MQILETSRILAVIQNDAGGTFSEVSSYIWRKIIQLREEQFKVYKTAVETMAGKNVIIRTLDIGADSSMLILIWA